MTITKITVKFNSGYTEDYTFTHNATNWINWFTNEYYKSHIQTFWINGVEFQEPPL